MCQNSSRSYHVRKGLEIGWYHAEQRRSHSFAMADYWLTEVINERATVLEKSIMFACLSDRQERYESRQVNNTKGLPLQIAVGIAVHQTRRSKKIIDMLNSFFMSADNTRILKIENQVANQLIKNIDDNNGVLKPHNFVRERYIFFALDNCDFAEKKQSGDMKKALKLTYVVIS